MPKRTGEAENLWLARALWELGGVRFGDFTLGRSTEHSPVYVNIRRIISRPRVLRRAARVMAQYVEAELGRLHPRVHPFQLVTGVPVGGLHIATAFSLATNSPMIYAYPARAANSHRRYAVEGAFEPDQTVLIVDDLITSGSSVLEVADVLRQEGLRATDAIVLIDRGQGAAARLRQHGCTLHSILSLEVMLNYYLSTGRIDQNLHKKCCAYLQQQ
ncbi:MAG: phosphoribosyltransferase [Chloroflexi bacterium]|nr:phosphoribosyltransferase [Chloroflexota bacterium]